MKLALSREKVIPHYGAMGLVNIYLHLVDFLLFVYGKCREIYEIYRSSHGSVMGGAA